MACSITVDVSSLHGQEIEYYFIVYDVVRSEQSRLTNIHLDAFAPLLDVLSPLDAGEYTERKVLFNISVDEEVTLEYIDHMDRSPRWKRLCSRCDSYEREKTFNRGMHDVVIRATDEGGNMDETRRVFTTNY